MTEAANVGQGTQGTGPVEDHDNCALPLVRRVYALLGKDDSRLRTGDPLPRGWHFILFTPAVAQHALGPDGTPKSNRAAGVPDDLPRRMMGGRRFTFFHDIPVGADVRRVSEVISSTMKHGRSGRFMIQTTRQLIYVDGNTTPALQEDTDGIFRELAPESASAATPAAAPRRHAEASEHVAIDETMLFRYSACTFNAHRIHYDQPYTTGVEGYPAVVVNAGLTVLLLRDFGQRLNDAPLGSMTTRNGRPIYCGTRIRLCATAVEGGHDLWAEDADGNVCAEVTLRRSR
jgi:3-methylfumaryl-CoA hydratase